MDRPEAQCVGLHHPFRGEKSPFLAQRETTPSLRDLATQYDGKSKVSLYNFNEREILTLFDRVLSEDFLCADISSYNDKNANLSPFVGGF